MSECKCLYCKTRNDPVKTTVQQDMAKRALNPRETPNNLQAVYDNLLEACLTVKRIMATKEKEQPTCQP